LFEAAQCQLKQLVGAQMRGEIANAYSFWSSLRGAYGSRECAPDDRLGDNGRRPEASELDQSEQN
jgi:hypothetical protein